MLVHVFTWDHLTNRKLNMDQGDHNNLGLIMRIPVFCICENKAADHHNMLLVTKTETAFFFHMVDCCFDDGILHRCLWSRCITIL